MVATSPSLPPRPTEGAGDGAPRPPAPPLRDRLAPAIERAAAAGGRRLAADLAPSGLTPPQYDALVAIDRAGACTMGALADGTRRALGTTTGLVDRLAGRGLVERRSAATDRRVVLVRLTAAGAALLAQVEARRRGRLDAVVAAMGEPAVRGLIHLLDGYRAALESDATHGRIGPEGDARG